jgi:hypothetical protein
MCWMHPAGASANAVSRRWAVCLDSGRIRKKGLPKESVNESSATNVVRVVSPKSVARHESPQRPEPERHPDGSTSDRLEFRHERTTVSCPSSVCSAYVVTVHVWSVVFDEPFARPQVFQADSVLIEQSACAAIRREGRLGDEAGVWITNKQCPCRQFPNGRRIVGRGPCPSFSEANRPSAGRPRRTRPNRGRHAGTTGVLRVGMFARTDRSMCRCACTKSNGVNANNCRSETSANLSVFHSSRNCSFVVPVFSM